MQQPEVSSLLRQRVILFNTCEFELQKVFDVNQRLLKICSANLKLFNGKNSLQWMCSPSLSSFFLFVCALTSFCKLRYICLANVVVIFRFPCIPI